eukprot:16439891-Heterocapsa_arctica.AAC.4
MPARRVARAAAARPLMRPFVHREARAFVAALCGPHAEGELRVVLGQVCAQPPAEGQVAEPGDPESHVDMGVPSLVVVQGPRVRPRDLRALLVFHAGDGDDGLVPLVGHEGTGEGAEEMTLASARGRLAREHGVHDLVQDPGHVLRLRGRRLQNAHGAAPQVVPDPFVPGEVEVPWGDGHEELGRAELLVKVMELRLRHAEVLWREGEVRQGVLEREVDVPCRMEPPRDLLQHPPVEVELHDAKGAVVHNAAAHLGDEAVLHGRFRWGARGGPTRVAKLPRPVQVRPQCCLEVRLHEKKQRAPAHSFPGQACRVMTGKPIGVGGARARDEEVVSAPRVQLELFGQGGEGVRNGHGFPLHARWRGMHAIALRVVARHRTLHEAQGPEGLELQRAQLLQDQREVIDGRDNVAQDAGAGRALGHNVLVGSVEMILSRPDATCNASRKK